MKHIQSKTFLGSEISFFGLLVHGFTFWSVLFDISVRPRKYFIALFLYFNIGVCFNKTKHAQKNYSRVRLNGQFEAQTCRFKRTWEKFPVQFFSNIFPNCPQLMFENCPYQFLISYFTTYFFKNHLKTLFCSSPIFLRKEVFYEFSSKLFLQRDGQK